MFNKYSYIPRAIEGFFCGRKDRLTPLKKRWEERGGIKVCVGCGEERFYPEDAVDDKEHICKGRKK